MKEYFTLDGKIEENRRFLRETQDKYEKIRNYYPLFFIYVGFVGIYSFDILQYILTTIFTGSVFFLSTLFVIHIALFAYVFYLFTKILILKDIAIDPQPKVIYSDYDEKKTDNNETDKELIEKEKKSYLLGLEEDVSSNYEILEEKKKTLSKVILYSIISFVVYISLITTYKISIMETPKKDKEKTEEIIRKPKVFLKDSKQVKTSLFSPEQENRVKEIVRDEIKNINKEKTNQKGVEEINKIKKLNNKE